MKFVISWICMSILGFLGLAILAVVGHAIDWMNITVGAVLFGLLLTWTFHPIAPKDFLGQHR
ncbi:hypothetical protein MUA95_11600 [Staphylococcus agnetis]|uniref:Uncharacterized protein n=1 Tax=Staphylococcus agnetis TaxID=985762 RepID=A0ABD7TSJ9_9STAP|nr:hypothetical protein [Staphylococcus agnetis]UXU57163.1 hypothetical protein MUA95_11600 [Staphylococcus agnetis]